MIDTDMEDILESGEYGRGINMNIHPIDKVHTLVEGVWCILSMQLRNAMCILLANSVASANTNGVVRYSRSKKKIHRVYNTQCISPDTYLKGIDILEQDGWILNIKAPRNTGKGKVCSRIAVTSKLLDYFSLSDMLEQEHKSMETYPTVIMRNEDGDDVGYRETSNMVGMRKVVGLLNLVNSQYRIEHMGHILDNSNISRIFNGGHKKGGRWYRCDIQQIKQRNKDGTDLPVEQTRLGVLIDGGHVVEVDFKSLHPLLLCAKHDIRIECVANDLYQHVLGEYNTNKADRSVVKLSLLRILNTDNPKSAKGAIQDVIKDHKGRTSFMLPSEVYNKIKLALPELYPYFHSKDQGLTLQYMDSMIVEEVANVFIEADKPLLPVHDSFVVKAEDENKLLEAMCWSFRKVTGNDNIPIGLKIKRWDGSEENYID